MRESERENERQEKKIALYTLGKEINMMTYNQVNLKPLSSSIYFLYLSLF